MQSLDTNPSVDEVDFTKSKSALYHEDVQGKTLWLIKLPHGVDPAQLDGKKIAFKKDIAIGGRAFKATFDGEDKTKLKALLPRKSDGALVPAGDFKGQLSLCETINLCVPTLPARLSSRKVIVQPKELNYSMKAFGTHKQPSSGDTSALNRSQSKPKSSSKSSKSKQKPKNEDVSTPKKSGKKKRKDRAEPSADADILGKKMKKSKKKSKKKSATSPA